MPSKPRFNFCFLALTLLPLGIFAGGISAEADEADDSTGLQYISAGDFRTDALYMQSVGIPASSDDERRMNWSGWNDAAAQSSTAPAGAAPDAASDLETVRIGGTRSCRDDCAAVQTRAFA